MTLPIQHCLKINSVLQEVFFHFTVVEISLSNLLLWETVSGWDTRITVVVVLLQVALSVAYITGRDPEMCGL